MSFVLLRTHLHRFVDGVLFLSLAKAVEHERQPRHGRLRQTQGERQGDEGTGSRAGAASEPETSQ